MGPVSPREERGKFARKMMVLRSPPRGQGHRVPFSSLNSREGFDSGSRHSYEVCSYILLLHEMKTEDPVLPGMPRDIFINATLSSLVGDGKSALIPCVFSANPWLRVIQAF